MKTYIRWTTREWDLIADRLVQQGVDPTRHGWRRELVDAMRIVLPKERWREATCLNAAKRLLSPLMSQRKEIPLPEKGAVQDISPPGAEALSTEDLLVELARRIAKLLEPTKAQAEVLEQVKFLERKFEEARIVDRGFHKCQREKAPEKVHKPRILVCGPNGVTAQALTTEFPGLDLRFIGYEENPARVMAKAQCVDGILVITKFVTHSIADAARAAGKTCTLVSSVRDAREWLAGVQT